MHALLQDLRYALRMLRRSPAATLIIIASLAIGIGANTAIFSVVNALLLKPLPYPDPDRLAVLWLRSPGINIPEDWPSPGQYIDIRNENRSFELMSISQGRSGTLLGREQPERVEALRTSSSLFTLLGAKPLHGRLLLEEDDVPGKAAVVILSHGFWQRVFGGDPAVVGRSLTINGVALGNGADRNQDTVAGVLGADFLLNAEIMPTVASIRQMDLFLPLPLGADAVTRRGDENYNLMARLKAGVTMEQADADVAAIAARIRDKDKRDRTFTIDVVPLLDQVVGERPAGGARAAGVGDAGAAHRLRERRQPAAHAGDCAEEGGRDPHRARRGLAAAGPPAVDRERAARRAGRRGGAADRQRAPCSWSTPSIPATFRGSTSSASTVRCSPSPSRSRS